MASTSSTWKVLQQSDGCQITRDKLKSYFVTPAGQKTIFRVTLIQVQVSYLCLGMILAVFYIIPVFYNDCSGRNLHISSVCLCALHTACLMIIEIKMHFVYFLYLNGYKIIFKVSGTMGCF